MGRKPRDHEFIWNTYGDWVATLKNGHLWDPSGLWLGWVEGRDVYKGDGEWIGQISKDFRIIRKRTERRRELNERTPQRPPKPDLPARAPLPPSFAEMNYSEIDVLEEDPDIFKKLSDLRKDME